MITTMMLEGYTPEQAYGWTANAQQESYKDLRTEVLGDKGKALGIFQWQKTRQQAMKDYAKQQGKPWNDLETQVRFSLIERYEGKAHRLLQQAKTVEQAVDAGLAYTRPSAPMRDRRLQLAYDLQAYYSQPFQKKRLAKWQTKQ